MAVTEQTPLNVSTATAGATVFAYAFKIIDKGDLIVSVNGVAKTVDVDFTLSGVGQDGGGNVTFLSPLAGGETVVRKRNMSYQRLADYQTLGDLRSATLNNDQDAPVLMIQQLAEDVSRSLHVAPGTTGINAEIPAPEANRALVWNETADELVNGELIDPALRNELGATGGAQLVAYKAPFTGSLVRNVASKLNETFSVEDFGAVGDGITNDTTALQSAINNVSAAGGGTISGLQRKSYRVQSAGIEPVSGRNYCLLMKSNVKLQDVRLVYNRTNTNTDLIITGQDGSLTAPGYENITLRNIFIDGNSDSPNTGQGFSMWMRKVKNLRIENVRSVNSTNWGLRIEQCDGVTMAGYSCDHATSQTNADGLHFVDCRNVTGHVGHLYTDGDDAFIIEANNFDVWNYNLSGIVVESVTGAVAAHRGVLIFKENSGNTNTREIRNISLEVVARNCEGSACAIQTGNANLSGCDIRVVSDGCNDGATIVCGQSGQPGTIRDNRFSIVASNTVAQGLFASAVNGTFTDNRIEAIIRNPGDGFKGCDLAGSRWSGSVSVDYNPDSTKTTFNYGVDISGAGSALDVVSRGAGTNLRLQGAADNNTIRLGNMTGAVTVDLELQVGAAGNRFVGGSINSITNSATAGTNYFENVGGATNRGRASLNFSTTANGQATFAHGLVGTPHAVLLQLHGSGLARHWTVLGVDATNVTVEMFTTAPAAITSGTFTYSFAVSL